MHNDVKNDNMVIARHGQVYEIKLMDFGLLTEMTDDGTGTKSQITVHRARQGNEIRPAEVPEGRSAPGDETRKIDGRKFDMYRLGKILSWMTGLDDGAAVSTCGAQLVNLQTRTFL